MLLTLMNTKDLKKGGAMKEGKRCGHEGIFYHLKRGNIDEIILDYCNQVLLNRKNTKKMINHEPDTSA